MGSFISMDSKITLKDVSVIIAFTIFLSSIKNDIAELRLKIDGRLNLYEYRLASVENKVPLNRKNLAPLSSALTPRSPNLTESKDDE